MQIHKFELGALEENCYVLIDDTNNEAAVIDPGEPSKSLYDFLTEKELLVRYIFLTHGHFDHILGVESLKEQTGAKVVIHREDKECLSDAKKSLYNRRLTRIPQTPVEADIILNGDETFEIGGIKISVMHTPGHTKGGVCYICGRNIFTGDTLFYRSIGKTSFPGGDKKELLNSVKRIDDLTGNYILYPGHGRSTTLDKEREVNRYVREARDAFNN